MANWPIRFTYGDRAVLYFAGVCAIVLVLNVVSFGNINKLAECRPAKDMKIYDIHRLFFFALAHKNTGHLTNNFATILMLGPNQEVRFGHSKLMNMFVVCAIVTGTTNTFLFKTAIVGANSVVFAFLILYASHYISFYSHGSTQTLPLTFALVFTFWFSKEISMTMDDGGSSGIAHIIGGIAGALYVLQPWRHKDFFTNLQGFFLQFYEAILDSLSTIFNGDISIPIPSGDVPDVTSLVDFIPTMDHFEQWGNQFQRQCRRLYRRIESMVHGFINTD